ncbi:hypothetical protein ACT3S9_16450 [Pseudoalteromonas sp. AOP31-A2-14]|uniref:hypothetical protein n=1 Tax=Pseudoalteromonas TaxID=53246 RepID=UPI003F9DF0E7
MNTLLLTLLLLSPNQASLTEQVQLELTHNLKTLHQENKIALKKQLKLTLDNTELALPIAMNPEVIVKNQATDNIKQLNQD